MNLEQIVLLVIASQGFLLSVALLALGIKRNYSSLFLGLITLVITLELLNAWGMQVGYHSTQNAFPFWIIGSYWILPSAIYLFAQINTQLARPKVKALLLFLPALIEIAVEFYAFYANKLAGATYDLLSNIFWFAFTEVLPVMAMVVVLVLYWRNLSSIKARLKELSIQKGLWHISKLYSFFILFALLTVFWFIQGILNLQVFIVIEVILSAFLFTLGFVGYFHPPFFDVPTFLNAKTSKEEFLHYHDDKELLRLKALFETDKIYLKPRLTMNELAEELNLPTRYLSNLISRYHQTDFRNFVNAYRVKEAIERIKDPKESHKTLLAIAMESGFSSKSSFNQIFKTFTGQKPSDYLVK